MKHKLTFRALLVGLLTVLLAFTAYGKTPVSTGNLNLSEDKLFGAITIEITQEAFNNFGFEPGDSVDVRFSNGFELKDVPYYTGHYVKLGKPMLIAYPGSKNIYINFKTGNKMWNTAGVSEKDTVCITLREAGKYKKTEILLRMKRSHNREDYVSDEVYANYRVMTAGRLKKDKLYRSSSPCDNINDRAKYANKLMQRDGIDFVLNFADKIEHYNKHIMSSDFESDYYKSLYDKGKVLLVGMGSNYRSGESKQIIAKALVAMSKTNGKCLLHCAEGKDRTGFVCALIEALAEASYDEIEADYMETNKNYFHVTKKDTPEKYDALIGINFLDIMETISGETDPSKIKKANLKRGAIDYLKSCGLTNGEIEKIIAYCVE